MDHLSGQRTDLRMNRGQIQKWTGYVDLQVDIGHTQVERGQTLVERGWTQEWRGDTSKWIENRREWTENGPKSGQSTDLQVDMGHTQVD